VAALCLGCVQRHAGVAQQFIPGRLLRTTGGKSYSRFDREPRRSDRERLSQSGDHPSRNLLDLKLQSWTLHENREFATCYTSDGVDASQDRLQPCRNQTKELVSHWMAMKVVHPLEVVEVYQKDSEAHAGTFLTLDRAVQEPVEQCPVGETGEAVMKRLVIQLRSTLFNLGLELATEGEMIEKD
jgi:hypothetical protein